MPARRNTFGTENAGACKSCQPGSTAAYAYSLRNPSGRIPSARAFSSAITTSAAAPSVSGEELPAVTLPYFLSKTGFSFAYASSCESLRTMLSSTTTCSKLGGTSTRITSWRNVPSAQARAA